MTTLQHLRDIVYFKYMVESRRRKEPEIAWGDGEFKVMYDIVKDEIFKELNIAELTTDISLSIVTVYTDYALPATFSGLISREIVFTGNSAYDIELKNMAEMPTNGSLVSGTPNRMAIFVKNDGLHYVYLYPLAGFSGTLTIRYKVLSEISGGGGAGQVLSGNIAVPLQYQILLIDGIMAQLFPDMSQLYYEKLEKAIYYRAVPTKGVVEYSFGGLSEEDFDDGRSKNWRGEY